MLILMYTDIAVTGRVLIPLSRIANMIISGRRADSTPSLAMSNIRDVTARSTGCIVLQDSVSLIPSGLSSDGIRTFELVRTVTRAYEYAQTVVTYKECVYDWAYQLPTLGIRHRKPRPYGNIPPSLRTYPIISEFGDFEWDLLQEGSITDIRKAFDMFMLDPFVQDANGASLYHVSILLWLDLTMTRITDCSSGLDRPGHAPSRRMPAPRLSQRPTPTFLCRPCSLCIQIPHCSKYHDPKCQKMATLAMAIPNGIWVTLDRC